MKITLDATPIGVRTTDKGGVVRYISQLIAALAEIGSSHRFRLLFNFCRSEHLAAFEEARRALESPQFEVVRSRVPSALWLKGVVPAELAAGRCDLFHGLYDFVPPVLLGASVLTIHDLRYISIDGATDPSVMRLVQSSPQLLASYKQRLDFFRRQRAIIHNVARRARLIITPSEFSRAAIVNTLGVPAHRVQVIAHGVPEELRIPASREFVAQVLQRHAIGKPYLLFVGKMDPLKNIELLLRAFALIRQHAGMQLVLTGPSSWYEAVLRQRVEELGIVGEVSFLGHVSDAELKALYSAAKVMVFPSLFEGFGLPVLEAMACGTPVVCSNHCSLPEVAADAALLVDPTSAETLARRVLDVWGDGDLSDRLRRAGLQRSSEFSWH